jgi:hypothetical protein
MTDRTPYARAVAGYDEEFEQQLAGEILRAITSASMASDTNVMLLRTGEMTAALIKVLALTLALSPCARSPTALRAAVDAIAKRLRRQAQAAIDDAELRDTRKHFFTDTVGGNA